jgi:outer membrane protein TolC
MQHPKSGYREERNGSGSSLIRLATLAGLVAAIAGAGGCATRNDYVPPPASAPARHEAPMGLPELPAGALSAQGAVRLALARNPDLASARARIEAAGAELDAAQAAFYPRLSADAGYLRGDAPSAYLFKTIDARALDTGTDFNHPGTFDNVEAGATLRWNLWNGGRNLLGLWAAEAAGEQAKAGRDAVENTLVAGVLAAFLEARAAGEYLAADADGIRAVEAQVAETKVRVEGGGALRSDLLSLEVRLAEVHEQRLRHDVARRVALAMLRHLLALPTDTPIALAPGGLDTGAPPATVSDALAEAYQHRPELEASRRAIERARLDHDASQRAYLPRLDAEGRLYWDGTASDYDGFSGRNWMAGVALTFDLFDGGSREAAIRRSKAALEEVEAVDRKALLAVALDVETSFLRLDEARARLDVASRSVAAAEETFTLVEKQFRGGAVPITRFLESEAAQTRARTAAIGARLDVDRAGVDVSRAVGRLSGASGKREERP